jgi:hypothetical protein
MVDFRVHKLFLSLASPLFFGGMFSLPQAEEFDPGVQMKDGLHIVPFDENKSTVATLLRMCYPQWMISKCDPLFPTLDHVFSVFVAARKYAMDGIEAQVRAELTAPRLLAESMRIFAFAIQYDLHPEAKLCAKQMLRTPILGREYIPELERITAGAYHRLQDYHVRCGAVAPSVATDVKWIENEKWVWFECSICRSSAGGNNAVVISGYRRKWAARWWVEYMLEASVQLKEQPSGATVGIDSKVAEVALSKASACKTCCSRVLRDMREFCILFAAEVEKITEQVSISSRLKVELA